MCGIAGYCLTADSDVDRTLAAQALLAGIAERGADAVGYAYRNGGRICVHNVRSARFIFCLRSTMWTGMRMVLALSASARATACRIHQVA